MNVFFEFHKIVLHLQSEGIAYALIGGVAIAFHAEPRFTKDIDILIRESDLDRVSTILKNAGYFPSAPSWMFKDCKLTLHRFLKISDHDEMMIDIMVPGDKRYDKIIDNALTIESEGTGIVRVAAKNDLIWLKSQRNSKQDQADIERLNNEKS